MKKAIYILSAAALVFASCDPVSDDKDFSFSKVDDAVLSSEGFFTFQQFNKAGEAQTDGNFFTYTTHPATIVEVFIENADGTRKMLTKKPGASGEFELSPARGGNANQTICIRAYYPDGTENVGKRQVNVFVKQELEPEVKLIASDYGKKTWKWAQGRRCWGNCDQSGATLPDVGGEWWGVDDPEGLLTQLNHAGGAEHGDESSDAYMIFTEDGTVTSYRGDGSIIYSSTYKISDYTADLHGYDEPQSGTHKDNWTHGVLHTDAAGILFPYLINGGGEVVYDYQISKLTVDQLTLTAAGHGWQDWGGETTYWRFTSVSDGMGLLTNYSEKSWKWNESGRVWGNCDQSGATLPADAGGEWWGCDTPEDLLTQLNHSEGAAHGDEATGAYMTFKNGVVTSYKPDGTEIRHAAFKLVDPEKYDGNLKGYDEPISGTHKDNWTLGELQTEGAGILFPYLINNEGTDPVVTSYQISTLTGDRLVLTAAGRKWQDWGGETTYWRFEAK